MSKKYYVGVKGTKREVFLSEKTPTADSHGHKFTYVIGAFRTKNGAQIMEKYGHDNPHLQTVSEAERMAKLHPELLK